MRGFTSYFSVVSDDGHQYGRKERSMTDILVAVHKGGKFSVGFLADGKCEASWQKRR